MASVQTKSSWLCFREQGKFRAKPRKVPERERLLASLFAALAAYAVLAFTPQIFNDGDTYSHIAAGTRMLSEHAVLFRDPFSYTFAGQPWSAHEWLSEIVMALAYLAGGWSSVALLFAGAFALAAGLLAWHLSRWFAPSTTLIVVALALSCMAGSLLARPHLLALPLLELWVAGLVIARSEHRKPSWKLLPVMTLWANLHGGFAFGFLLLAYAALEALIEEDDKLETLKSWGFFSVGAVIAALLTPHFIDGLIFPFRLVAMSQLANIGEWGPANFATLQPFEIVIAAALYIFLSRGVKLPIGRLLISLLLLHLALQHVRHQLVFAAVVPLLLAEPLAHALNARSPSSSRTAYPGWILAALMLAACVSVARLSWPISLGERGAAPIYALAHVPKNVISTPVLNDYSFGGYLMFKGVPVFIDSRAELYGDDFLRNYSKLIRPDAAVLRATLEKYKIGWTILTPNSPTVAVLDLLPGWRRLYADQIAVVHVRDLKR